MRKIGIALGGGYAFGIPVLFLIIGIFALVKLKGGTNSRLSF